jgi:hypothetical protein
MLGNHGDGVKSAAARSSARLPAVPEIEGAPFERAPEHDEAIARFGVTPVRLRIDCEKSAHATEMDDFSKLALIGLPFAGLAKN